MSNSCARIFATARWDTKWSRGIGDTARRAVPCPIYCVAGMRFAQMHSGALILPWVWEEDVVLLEEEDNLSYLGTWGGGCLGREEGLTNWSSLNNTGSTTFDVMLHIKCNVVCKLIFLKIYSHLQLCVLILKQSLIWMVLFWSEWMMMIGMNGQAAFSFLFPNTAATSTRLRTLVGFNETQSLG